MHPISKPTLPPRGLSRALGSSAVRPARVARRPLAPRPAAAAGPKPGDFRGFSGVHWPSTSTCERGTATAQRITENPRRGDAIASLGQRRALNRTAAMLVGAHLPDLLPARRARNWTRATGPAWARCWSWAPAALGALGQWRDRHPLRNAAGCRPGWHRRRAAARFRIKASGNDKHVKRTAMACEAGPDCGSFPASSGAQKLSAEIRRLVAGHAREAMKSPVIISA